MKSTRLLLCFLVVLLSASLVAAEHNHDHRHGGQPLFTEGEEPALNHLPACKLKERLAALPEKARKNALRMMAKYSVGHHDLSCLESSEDGALSYVCPGVPAVEEAGDAVAVEDSDNQAAPTIWDSGFTPGGSVTIDSPPVFNSKPGATNIIYIDFNGAVIENTAWNTNASVGAQTTINARAYDLDGDGSTFTTTEQTRMYQIWQRVAEDFAPFDVNVTTDPFYDDVSNRGPTIGQILVSHNADFGGDNAGGRAWLGVFGFSNYHTYYSPALVYYNKLGSGRADYVAEASSHEMGHNLGLSHDGLTSGANYYTGHGSGQTSWGPIMGTGYNDNVSQWSKGEYYNANNTQDDEAVIVNDLGYRADDHGDDIASASFLTVDGGTTIDNTNAANQGIILNSTDVDVFAFSTGAGEITLQVDPFVVGTNTRGGNLDVALRLLDASGTEIASANPASLTGATITATVPEGAYYLEVRSTGTGDPFSSTPSGYVATHSQGQYFVSGTVFAPISDPFVPLASLNAADVGSSGAATYDFTVTYTDNIAVDVSTIDNNDVQVTGPNSFAQVATLVSVDNPLDGSPRTATYRITPPGGFWDLADNGTYNIFMQGNAVQDTSGGSVPSGLLGSFTVGIVNIVTVYDEDMNNDPGWTLDGQWDYGTPSSSNDPTDRNCLGYNHTGNGLYSNGMSAAEYATSPAIDCSSLIDATLEFKQYAGIKNKDTAVIQISGNNGSTWSTIYNHSGDLDDGRWNTYAYDISSLAAGKSQVRIRFGLGPTGSSLNSYGWNLDDFILKGNSTSIPGDTSGPAPSLSITDITSAGGTKHTFTVTYTDPSDVDILTLGFTDLRIVGPSGYDELATYVGVDVNSNGSPRTATYEIPAAGGSWDSGDNGNYTVSLRNGEVADTLGNYTGSTALGSFAVTIAPPAPPVINSSLTASGQVGTAFSYTITATNSPASFNATSLPAGLGVDTSTGVISGTPTTAGTYNVTITATNSDGSDSETLVITINNPPPTAPEINSSLTASGQVGVAFSYTITGTNSPTSFNAVSLPPGLSVNTSSGLIDGAPTTAGTYNVPITATNAGGSDTETLVITIDPAAPVINSPLTATGNEGSPFSYTVTATNSPTSFNATPLPPGLSFNNSSGVISGTPTIAGTYHVTMTATNAGGSDSETLVITVNPPPPVIDSALTATGQVGIGFSYTISATNTPTSFNATSLPPGLSVNVSTGEISGTPTAAGSYNVTITAVNASGNDSETLLVTINPAAPLITSALSATGTVGGSFSYTITATNSPTSFNATSLPPGLSVDTGTGIISGAPATAGTYNVNITATNAGGSDSQILVITVSNPPVGVPVINSSLTASGMVGAAFSYTISATNTPTSFNATGLPAGLSINTSTGLIDGTPTTAGTYNVTITATNVSGSDSQTLVITIVDGVPVISSSLTVNGVQGAAFSYTITASNGPTSFNATSLPPGLSVNPSSGVISGTPTAQGVYNVTISATNVAGTDTQTLVITIDPPTGSQPLITSSLSTSATVGLPYSYNIVATNSPTGYNATGLPPGLSVNTTSGLIDGTPTTAGIYNVTITATNTDGSDSKTLVITVNPADTVDPGATSVKLIISGHVSRDTVSLTFNGVSVPVDGLGQYSASISVPGGSKTITVVATDGAGNSTTRTIDTISSATIPGINN